MQQKVEIRQPHSIIFMLYLIRSQCRLPMVGSVILDIFSTVFDLFVQLHMTQFVCTITCINFSDSPFIQPFAFFFPFA